METYIDTIRLEDGNIQKYQVVKGFEWDDLNYKVPIFDKKVLVKMSNLYKENIIPKEPKNFGVLVFYKIPTEFQLNLENDTEAGLIFNDNILLNFYFQKAADNKEVYYQNNKILFKDENLQKIYDSLLNLNLISLVCGENSNVQFMPMHENFGFMSKLEKSPVMVNSHFFLMDMTDKDSEYDLFGTPHGLVINDGEVLLPPLNHRQSMFLDFNNNVEIKTLELDDLDISIGGKSFKDGINCKFFFRPENRITDKTNGLDIIIVNKKVVATKIGGNSRIPMAGFVIQVDQLINLDSLDVVFGLSTNYKIAIEVGPALLINGKKTIKMNCPFYEGSGTPYPSTVYPLNFDTSRAARIGLGEIDGNPLLIWAEGAGKLGYIKGEESCGASLREFADYCDSKNIRNLINLDGGGSAQLIYKDKRYLKIADRLSDKVTEDERPVPNCWVVQ
jgi:hypothetical protein